jgi:hypothetical protein
VLTYRTYRGDRLDLEFYKGKAVIDFEVLVYNDDGTDFDLTVYSSFHGTLAHKRHGTVVLPLTEPLGHLTIASPADNSIYLNISDSEIDIRTKEYYLEVWGQREDDESELIFHGNAVLI